MLFSFRRNFFIAIIALQFVACSETTEDPATTTTAEVKLIGPDAFEELITSTPSVQLVDVRTPGEWEQGVIASPLKFDWNAGEFTQRINELNKQQPVAVYCRSGNRSAGATQLLADKGFQQIYELDGGIKAWEAAGKPVN